MRAYRAFTLLELMVVVLIIFVIMGIAIPVLLSPHKRGAQQVRDSTQIKQMHTGFLTAAADKSGLFPLPGEVNRAADPVLHYPARGPIDESRNEHASLHSVCIAMNYYSPQILVSPMETNAKVLVCTNYNFNSYTPAQDKFWDETSFKADLNTVCHVSYACSPLDQTARRRNEWRNSSTSTYAILGTRGRKGGATPWKGNVCYNDNHTVWSQSPQPTPQIWAWTENIFTNDTIARQPTDPLRNSDMFLVIQKDAAAPGTFIDENSSAVTWD